MHDSSAFVTLTYADESLPSDGSVSVVEMQKLIRRMRKEVAPKKFRYFVVGEYGDRTWRPHYHAVFFGLEGCYRGRTDHRKKVCCLPCEFFRLMWRKGRIESGPLNSDTADYIGGYTCKKLTTAKDIARIVQKTGNLAIKSLRPEFARMSLRPGIGALVVPDVALSIKKALPSGSFVIPSVLKHGKKARPLGRYLKRLICEKLGFDPKAESEKNISSFEFEMRELYEKVLSNPENCSLSLAAIVEKQNKQKVLNLESRQKLYGKRRKL